MNDSFAIKSPLFLLKTLSFFVLGLILFSLIIAFRAFYLNPQWIETPPDPTMVQAFLLKSMNGIEALALQHLLLFGLPVYLTWIIWLRKESFNIGWHFKWLRWNVIFYIIVIFFGVMVIEQVLQTYVLSHDPNFIKSYKEMTKILLKISDQYPVVLFLFVVILVPILEELFFRVLIFRSFLRFVDVNLALILNGMLFGLFHGTFVQLFSASIIGMLLAFIYYRTRSIWPAIILHAINNGIAYFTLNTLVSESGEIIEIEPTNTPQLMIILICGAVLVIYYSIKFGQEFPLEKKSPQ